MRPELALLALAVFAGAPARAAETQWQQVAPDVAIRLISAGPVSADGKALLALEIDMPASTKTYWRVPGETGLPMDLDLSGSAGVAGYELHWPYPTRESKGSNLDYVYYGHTVLPLEVGVSDAQGTVDLAATLGICSDICVPAQVRFTLPLSDNGPDQPNDLRIRQAMAEVPIVWTGGAEPVGPVTMLPEGGGIGVVVDSGAMDAASVIAASEDGSPLFGAPQKSPQSNLVVLPILGKSDNSALEGLDVEVTFMTDTGAYMVNRTIEAGVVADAVGLDQ